LRKVVVVAVRVPVVLVLVVVEVIVKVVLLAVIPVVLICVVVIVFGTDVARRLVELGVRLVELEVVVDWRIHAAPALSWRYPSTQTQLPPESTRLLAGHANRMQAPSH
jgi:hypothetical protein